MQYFNIKYFKTIVFTLLAMVIGSLTAWATFPFPMFDCSNSCVNRMTETQEFLLTGDGILFGGFLLWITYVLFSTREETAKQL